MTDRQATCVAIGGRGLLIEGPTGSGKSSLALTLIDRGAVLVGDDSLRIAAEDGRLLAMPHPQTRGLLEIRNLGLVPMPVCEKAPVGLVITLDANAPRFIEETEITEIEGIRLPHLRLWPDSPVLALKAEIALERFRIAAR